MGEKRKNWREFVRANSQGVRVLRGSIKRSEGFYDQKENISDSDPKLSVMQGVKDESSGGGGSGGGVVRKGPWTAEEDEILMEYVRKNGPRDWSSIRSKGLLPRTGKSCRLRWVNKLKPDLKTGCKFSPEEEHIVIDLQARFGNKWARIATYLPGRTDNDVKNFWSTRQKRLARILKTTALPAKSDKNLQQINSAVLPPPAFEPGPLLPCEGQCSSSLRYFDDNIEIPLLAEGSEMIPGFSDMSFHDESSFAPQGLPFFGLDLGLQGIKREPGSSETPDGFFDDFPTDMFDCLDHPPASSSSTW
ncbi:hypothetical protein J5N97_018627 [Dioscorea zingiberensis]|uniref:Uncharacterized protein n=1 Tax=Dioscorea zingiberensis TaxID=325984 RepID=A0A9D5HC36_9LILI|nr:hypothetical protein J5N97_018627 [Dioscorea zingiberensis]